MKRPFLLAAVLLGLAGCATQQPFSYINGNKWYRADLDSYSVIVLEVDGKNYTTNPVMVDPGRRVIKVQGPPGGGRRTGEDRTFVLEVEPCTHYYLKAVRKNALADDFEPMVDYHEPIHGCKPTP